MSKLEYLSWLYLVQIGSCHLCICNCILDKIITMNKFLKNCLVMKYSYVGGKIIKCIL